MSYSLSIKCKYIDDIRNQAACIFMVSPFLGFDTNGVKVEKLTFLLCPVVFSGNDNYY